jgi:tetratricopeptide (TPR) repeat protein
LIVIVFSLKAMMDKLIHRRTWQTIVTVLLTGIYAPLTWAQVQTWRDSETLYRHALTVTGDNFLAHHALGHTLAMRNDMIGAIDHFYRAAVIRPDKAPLWVSLGKALALDDQWQSAEQAFSRAARLEPERPAVWFYLGCARIAQQDQRMALDFLAGSLSMARQQNPRAGPIYVKLMDFYENGLYYDDRGQWPLAGAYYLKALALACGDLSRRRIAGLVVDGYDQWLKGVTGF